MFHAWLRKGKKKVKHSALLFYMIDYEVIRISVFMAFFIGHGQFLASFRPSGSKDSSSVGG